MQRRVFVPYHSNNSAASWQFPTLALFLILLAFFIILGQMSAVESQKFQAMQKSVQSALKGFPKEATENLASSGVDPKSAAAIQDIVNIAYTDISNAAQSNWDILLVRQDKIANALDITLNAPAVLLDDTSPYPPEQRLSGVLVAKMLEYQTPSFKWQLNVRAQAPQNIDSQQVLAADLMRFTRALMSRGLKNTQVRIGFDQVLAPNTVQLYLIPVMLDAHEN
jgi:flagellar motor protein MotB